MLLIVSLLVGIVAGLGQEIPDLQFEGRTIGRIEFDPPEQPLPRAELDRLLPFQIGSSLRRAEVRAAIQKLYQTGRFSDISIDVELDDGLAVMRIATQPTYFVSQVKIDGVADPPNLGQLTTATKLDLGGEFADNDLKQATENMLDRLRANGLYGAKVTYEVGRIPATEEVNVRFQIEPGKRARFDGVRLMGEPSETADKTIRATGWRRGIGPILLPGWREATENRIQNGVEGVRKNSQRGDHVQARVTLQQLDYHDKTNTVTPTLVIDGGPVLQVQVTGAKVSNSRLRQLLPIYEERSVDRSLLLEGQRNLVEYFQSQGYFDAEVEFAEKTLDNNVRTIDFSVERSVRHKLKHIEITGNQFFDDATLRERLSVTEASFPRSRVGRFSQQLLQDDRETIRDLYRANGFRDVEVMSKAIDNYEGRANSVAAQFDVKEGSQWRVNQLTIEGAPPEDLEYLRSIAQSNDGQPFSDASIAGDRDSILSYYYNNGYPRATFDWVQTDAPAPNRVNLRYTVVLGKREFVRTVLIRGLNQTNPSLVASRISVKDGDPISQSQISESQQKLYDLGIFSKVQTATQNPDGDEESKNILFAFDEARKYSFTVGGGAQLARIGGGVTTLDSPAGQYGFSPRLSLGISRLNFLGLGHTVSLQTLVSTVEQRALLSYTAPQFTGNENLALTFSGLFDNSYDVRTFAAKRYEGSVQLAQRLTRANTIQYRYTFRHVTVDAGTLKISPELIPLLSQPERVGQLSVSFIEDRRDDPTNTRRGFYNTVDVGFAARQLASQTDFTRIVLRNSTYHRLGRDLVLARSLQFGYIQRLRGLPEIPLAERFFSGGASSDRAFPDNQAGPRDGETGFPLGGNALLFHETELRFPLIGENVGGVLFHDMGNVYSDIRNVSFRYHQQGMQDFNYMVHAVGFGLRYRTPVGPLRVDLAYGLNPPSFVGFKGTLQDLLACNPNLPPAQLPAACQSIPQSINHIQFFFSLGQTF